jgi:cathepsin L
MLIILSFFFSFSILLSVNRAKAGVATESAVPYRGVDAACPSNVTAAVKVGSYVQLPVNNASALLEAVAFVGPISVSVDAMSWSFYGGGVFNGCNAASPDIDHAVQLVGFGTDAASKQDYWLVRNSWGTSWGEAGYIRLYRGSSEACGMDKTPGDGSACEGDTNPVQVCGTCGIWYDNSYPTEVTKA